MSYRVACLCVGLFGFVPSLAAQSSEILLKAGDAIPAVGDLVFVDELEISDAKDWLVHAHARTPSFQFNEALFDGGPVLVREGMRLDSPPGASLHDFDSIDTNDSGDVALVARIRLPSTPGISEAVLWNRRVLVLEGDPLTAPRLPAGSTYDSFDFVKLSDRGTLLVIGIVRTPVAPSRRDVMVQFQLDELGNVLDSSVFAVRFQDIPGIPGAVLGAVGSAETSFAMNNHGDIINYAFTSLGSAVLLDLDVPLAQQGLSSPVGRNWSNLMDTRVALNDAGAYVLTGLLDGSTDTYLIEKSGEKFAQEGDVLPALSPLPLLGRSRAPIHLANTGDVFWHARVDGDEAFMRNHEPIVRPGTVAEGLKVAELDVTADAFTISPDGRFFLCNVELADGADATLFLDFGLALELPGCTGNTGELALSAGQVRVGQTIELAMDAGPVAGALARIHFASALLVPDSDCGIVTPAGELLISPLHRVASLFPAAWDGTNPTSVVIPIPNDLALVDRVLFAQGAFRTPGTQTRSLTNALRIEIGAP